jgi:hypothetical protein
MRLIFFFSFCRILHSKIPVLVVINKADCFLNNEECELFKQKREKEMRGIDKFELLNFIITYSGIIMTLF